MKAKMLLVAMGVVFAGSAMAAGPYQDSTDIHFSGEVQTNLCAVGVPGGATVTLDPTDVGQVSRQSGTTPVAQKAFTIVVDCSEQGSTITDNGLSTMTGYLTAAAGTEVDAATTSLKNNDATGAQNVGLGVLSTDDGNKLQTFTSADKYAQALTASDNKYNFNYKVGYMKLASGVTAGAVAADTTFIVDYQ